MQPRQPELCDTLYYQGMNTSQTQALKYTGNQTIQATTGELMWCEGRNQLPPLNVIYRLHIGCEIADVNLAPFQDDWSWLNPINWIGAGITYASNYLNGFLFLAAENPAPESVVFHAPVFSNVSIGQETDINSHRQKYRSWLQSENHSDGLILYGVSRGTAATFCAYAREQYPEVKLVILEGAIDSVANILPKRCKQKLKYECPTNTMVSAINYGLSLFTAYRPDGVSPLSSVNDYPENTPTVFITSEVDQEVPCENTENIANALASRGRNDVYLLKLKRSSHPNYMFDDKEDRDTYEAFIHAIYRKYGLKHDEELANRGEGFLDACQIGRCAPILDRRLG